MVQSGSVWSKEKLTTLSMSFIFYLLLIIYSIGDADKCVSNRRGSSSVVNGHYLDDGTNEGKPSYKLTNSANCSGTFYLYYHNQGNNEYRWWIGPEKGGVTYWSRCNEQTETPQLCQSWAFPSNDADVIDTDVSVIDGACPELSCDALEVIGSSYPSVCDGIFDIDTTENIGNVFYNSRANRYWYWYPEFNQWFCADIIERDCSPTVSASGGDEFIDISLGSMITMNTRSGTTNSTATIKCIDKSVTTTLDPMIYNSSRLYTGIGICLWDAIISGASSIFNGYYEEIDYNKNGRNYYVQSTQCSQYPSLYIYFVGNPVNVEFPSGSGQIVSIGGWIISQTSPLESTNLGDSNPLSWCPLSLSETTSPLDCNGNWRFSDDTNDTDSISYSLYPSITITNGKCPTLNCAQLDITSTTNNNPCVGSYYPLDTNEDDDVDNVYKRDDNTNYYWYFNPNAFYWICNQGGYSKTCSLNINNGDYGPNGFLINYPQFSFLSQYRTPGTLTFKCYDRIQTDSPSPAPTSIPSKSPTTKSPTDSTDSPSMAPTEYHTDSPSISPTDNTPAPNADGQAVGSNEPTLSPIDVNGGNNGNDTNQHLPNSIIIMMTLCLSVLIPF